MREEYYVWQYGKNNQLTVSLQATVKLAQDFCIYRGQIKEALIPGKTVCSSPGKLISTFQEHHTGLVEQYF